LPGSKAQREEALKNHILSTIGASLIGVGLLTIAAPASAQGLITEQRLSAALVNEALGVAVATCATNGYKVSAVVLDMDGVRMGMLRGDGAGIHTVDSSFLKAYTSVTYREDTINLEKNLKNGQMSVLQTKLPNVAVAAGAVSIKVNGVAIGALGVGGAPGGEKDTVCAQAGVDKIRDRMK
jgi:uncharacterized protein GlcG (DUF336 family)